MNHVNTFKKGVHMTISVRHIKRTSLRFLFGLEILLFCWVYLLGPHGIQILWCMRQENEQALCELNEISGQVKVLGDEIAAWGAHAFYKEKVAREQLQMARADDIVYLLS